MMRRVLLIITIMFVCMFCGCKSVQEYEENIFAMDTIMTIKVYGDGGKDAVLKAKEELFLLDKELDRKEKSNEIFKLNEEKDKKVSEDIYGLIERAKIISEKTDGNFDITIAPVMDLWGFYGEEFTVPTDIEIDECLKKVSYKNIEMSEDTIKLRNNATIDLGGIAKGYASDVVCKIIKNSGINSAIISLGGNVFALGKRPDGDNWRVGIQDPQNKDKYIGTLEIFDKAVVTSGGYERFFEYNGEKFHHIIDPKTGVSSNNGLKSVTIVAKSCEYADGLSTALYVMGLDKAIDLWRKYKDFEAVFITDNGEINVTYGLKDCFTSEKEFKIINDR